MTRIREIRNAGFEVGHVIHRHGMVESTAFEVEAALIDAYPGLTNLMDGHGNSDYGVMHATEVVKRYSAKVADFSNHRILLISMNGSATEWSLYDAVRYAWGVKKPETKRVRLD
jgi:hypothetical protein